MSAPFKRVSLRHQPPRKRHPGALAPPSRSTNCAHSHTARQLATKLGIDIAKGAGAGKIASAIFESLWEEHLIQPTFVYDFPTEVSPLSSSVLMIRTP